LIVLLNAHSYDFLPLSGIFMFSPERIFSF
jgi:hypothetical protein